MTTHLKISILMILGVLILQGCTVQKRVHMPGWHITTHIPHKPNRTEASIYKTEKLQFNSSQNETRLPVTPETFEMAEIKSNTPSKTSFRKRKVTRLVLSKKTLVVANSFRPFVYGIPSKLVSHPKETDEKKESLWASKLAGGFLGATLALVALLPLFLVTLFLMNGDADDLFEFSVSNQSSAFFQAFQETFNVVFKIGTAVLFIALVALVVGAFISFLYIEYGILGVLLGILCFVLLMILLIQVFERLFELFFPDY